MFSRFLADLLIKLPNSVLMVERKSTGSSIMDSVIEILDAEGINAFKRIFSWVVDELEKYAPAYPELFDRRIRDFGLYIKFKKHFGFATSGNGKTSRSKLYGSVIKGAGKYISEFINDKVLADQLLGLTVRNGRIDHVEGGHDDMVIAWLLGYWFMTEAKNKDFYGIDSSKILSSAVDAELIQDATPEEREYIRYQERLREKINELLVDLENTVDPTTALRIIGKINVLKEGIDLRYNKSFNVDAILNEMKFYKKLKKLNMIRD